MRDRQRTPLSTDITFSIVHTTAVDLEDVNHATLQIPRDDVNEIRRWTRGRGSRVGAVLGAAGGFVLGYLSAITLVYKQCGGSSADEKVLIGLSLVGMPIGGGLAGYHLLGKDRTLTTISLKP